MRKKQIKSIKALGASGKHARMKIYSQKHSCDAVAWDMGEKILELQKHDLWDMVVKLEINRYKGDETLRMNLLDITPSLVESLV